MEPSILATFLGLGSGVILGLAARLGQFCTFGAIESAYLGNDQRRIERRAGTVQLREVSYPFGLWRGPAEGVPGCAYQGAEPKGYMEQ